MEKKIQPGPSLRTLLAGLLGLLMLGICLSEVLFIPSSCLVSGTLVATPTGPRAIESLAIGDPVLSRAPSGELAVSWVTATYPAQMANLATR